MKLLPIQEAIAMLRGIIMRQLRVQHRQQAAKEQQLAAERERAEKTRKQGTQACERARAGAGPSAAWVRREREADGGRAIDPACPGPPAAPG